MFRFTRWVADNDTLEYRARSSLFVRSWSTIVFLFVGCGAERGGKPPKSQCQMKDEVKNFTRSLSTVSKEGPCEVFFFKSWATYQHPVTPVGPLSLEKALMRKSHYRAYMCDSTNGKLFVRFDLIELEAKRGEATSEILQSDYPVVIYEAKASGQGYVAGDRIRLNQILERDHYFVGSGGPSASRPKLVGERLAMQYLYKYEPDGRLGSVVIQRLDGETRKLRF